ncbi:MAG TPA: MFS transporter [Anaerolineae bacterium]|nr:MFS transporter [Anaerolineae bacterium]
MLGATVAGLTPIVLPLVVSRVSSAADVGLVMAALSLGGLAAPVWGSLADRYRLHRPLLVIGLLATTIGLAAFPLSTAPAAWLGLALLQGMGASAAATVANLFVVEMHPQAEWDERIGWLQTFYGGGQVAGLLLAGIVSQADPRVGLVAAAGLTALALLPGWLTTQTPSTPVTPKPTLLHPARHSDWAVGSPQRHFHHLSLSAVRRLGSTLRSRFGLLLLAWLLSFAGAAAIFSLYPVLMQQVYGIAPGFSSAGFAIAAGLALALYAPAGHLSDRFGARRVLQVALGVRLLAVLGLFGLGFAHVNGQGWLALLSFLFVVLAWSLINVSGTALAAQLSPFGEGEGMGVFNATTALAGVIGAALGGWIAGWWGYHATSGLAAVGIALGLVVTAAVRPRDRTTHPERER